MKLKKVMAATLATMMCLSSFSMMNVWADKKEDSEPLVINYISARGETDAALKTLKKLAEDYKKDHPDFEFNVESIADRETYLQKIRSLHPAMSCRTGLTQIRRHFLKDFAKRI